jgi:hypothetical protein
MNRRRDVALVVLGVAGLVLKGQYAGPGTVMHDYGGNVAASWSVYFLAKRVTGGTRWPAASAAVLAGLAVELFEVLDGFGFMSNAYDSMDLVANLVGIAAAVLVDRAVTRRGR